MYLSPSGLFLSAMKEMLFNECSLIVYGDAVPSPNAAFVNGVMAHILELDDVSNEASSHTSLN